MTPPLSPQQKENTKRKWGIGSRLKRKNKLRDLISIRYIAASCANVSNPLSIRKHPARLEVTIPKSIVSLRNATWFMLGTWGFSQRAALPSLPDGRARGHGAHSGASSSNTVSMRAYPSWGRQQHVFASVKIDDSFWNTRSGETAVASKGYA